MPFSKIISIYCWDFLFLANQFHFLVMVQMKASLCIMQITTEFTLSTQAKKQQKSKQGWWQLPYTSFFSNSIPKIVNSLMKSR